MIGKRKKIGYYIFLNIIIIGGLIIVLQLWNSNILKYPLGYSGDATQVYYFYNTYIQDGVFSGNSRAGIPYISDALDFSTGEFISIFTQSLIMKLAPNFVAGVNIMFLLGFILAGNITFYVLSRMDYSYNVSLVGAVVYAFLPYHFFRGIVHFMYGFYWFVPLLIYYVIYYLTADEENGWGGDKKLSDYVMHIIMIIAAASHGIYFTFFSMFFVTVALVIKVIFQRKKSKIWIDFIAIFSIYLLSCVPIVLSRIRYGANPSVASRLGMESELYSLKVAQLLMPITGHRISLLNEWRNYYNSYPLTNENHTVSLGLCMSIGLVFLLLGIFVVFNNIERKKTYVACVKLSAAALLLASVGTFSTFISFILSGIRGYNRIAPFVAFIALLGFVIILELLYKRIHFIVSILFTIVIISGGIYDQTSTSFIPQYNVIKEKWDNDEKFVSEIEKMEPEGAWIFQMPYVSYPEAGTTNGMGDYEEFTGLFHSKNLKWSYGAIAGREGDIWFKQLQNYNMEEQVRRLSVIGFAGIYVDKSGMGEKFESTIAELQEILKVDPIISDNQNLYYYTMSKYNKKTKYGTKEYENINIFQAYSSGFYDEVIDEDNNILNWSRNESEIDIYNMNKKDLDSVEISFNIDFVDGKQHTLTITTDTGDFEINQGQTRFTIDLKDGKNTIYLSSDCEEVFDEYQNALCYNISDFLLKCK